MATYYRWSKSTTQNVISEVDVGASVNAPTVSGTIEYGQSLNVAVSGGTAQLVQDSSYSYHSLRYNPGEREFGGNIYVQISSDSLEAQFPYEIYKFGPSGGFIRVSRGPASGGYATYIAYIVGNELKGVTTDIGKGIFQNYVYSVSASAYPNGSVSGSYYYDQRTTITSPTAPGSLSYPSPITTPSVTVSWGAASTNVPQYGVSTYEVSYATNGGGVWTVVGTTSSTNMAVTLPAGITSIQFRVRAQDSNGQWSSYTTGTSSNVILAPTLTVPSLAMQGENITVNWTAVDNATSYTLQRKANTDTDWVQAYSGSALTFTEAVGTWTSVQYQVQAVFSSGAGGWATSPSIPVVSASALVISGTDSDLGTLTTDVPYTVSSDTGNPITLKRTVNGNLVATLTVQSGFAYTIPVMDLPTGSGTIVISATVNASTGGGTVSATRTWTYTKTPTTFPSSGGVANLTQNGQNVLPITISDAVRVPTAWGGSLDKALELLLPVVNAAVVSVGSYVGTGTYGADDPNTLTFTDEPQVVTIYGGGQTLVISSTDTSSPSYISGKTATWYSTTSAADQMNSDGVTYSYVAVAKGVTA